MTASEWRFSAPRAAEQLARALRRGIEGARAELAARALDQPTQEPSPPRGGQHRAPRPSERDVP